MQTDTTAQSAAIFAANRARGAVRFDVHDIDGVTRRRELHEAGSLRVRFPSPEDAGLSAVLVNTAGGIAGGDRFDIDIASDGDARLTVTTRRRRKSTAPRRPPAELNVTLKAEGRSHLAWLPQETILFDRTRIHRRFEIDLSEDGLASALRNRGVRPALRWASGFDAGEFVDRWRLRRGGRLVLPKTSGSMATSAASSASPAVAKGGVAIGTALIVPGDEALVRADSRASQTLRRRGRHLRLERLCDGPLLCQRCGAATGRYDGGARPRRRGVAAAVVTDRLN